MRGTDYEKKKVIFPFIEVLNSDKSLPALLKKLRAIFRENRKSHDTRGKNEFFFLSPKHPF